MFAPKSNGMYFEAVVLAVDIRRSMCKCKTRDGHMLTNVSWARPIGSSKENGETYSPMPGEVVILAMVNNEPIILFSRNVITPINGTIRPKFGPITETDSTLEDYNLGVASKDNRSEGASPIDVVPGDKVISNDRGSLIALLRSGTLLLKASPLAQVVVSRIDDLIRLIARNYEQFSDAVQHLQVNIKGRVYTYTGFYRTQTTSVNDKPEYYEIVGNVEAGDEARGTPLTADVESVVEGNLVKKQVVSQYDDAGEEITPRSVHTLDLNGEALRGSYNAANTDSSVEELKNNSWKLTVTDATGSSFIFIQPVKITLNSNGTALMEMDGAASTITMHADVDINIDAGSNVNVTAGTKVLIDAPTIEATCDTLTATSTTSNLTLGTATVNMTTGTISASGPLVVSGAPINLN